MHLRIGAGGERGRTHIPCALRVVHQSRACHTHACQTSCVGLTHAYQHHDYAGPVTTFDSATGIRLPLFRVPCRSVHSATAAAVSAWSPSCMVRVDVLQALPGTASQAHPERVLQGATQADTGAPLATPLNTALPSWNDANPVPPQHRSLADRMRAPFGGRAGRSGASDSAGPYNV